MKTYPQASDIKEHKDRLWTTLLQYYKGLVPIESVEQKVRSLMGDAALWIKNNSPPALKPLDLEKVKKEITSLSFTVKPQIEMTIKRPEMIIPVYFNSVQDLENFNKFMKFGIKNIEEQVLKDMVTGKEFMEEALKKAVDWNHGTVPEIGVRHTFLCNALDELGVKVLVEKEKIT